MRRVDRETGTVWSHLARDDHDNVIVTKSCARVVGMRLQYHGIVSYLLSLWGRPLRSGPFRCTVRMNTEHDHMGEDFDEGEKLLPAIGIVSVKFVGPLLGFLPTWFDG